MAAWSPDLHPNHIDPKVAIVVDVIFASDHPNVEKKEIGEHKIGSGPVLTRGAAISPVVLELLRGVADRQKIPYTVHAAGRETSTNADTIHITRARALRPQSCRFPIAICTRRTSW